MEILRNSTISPEFRANRLNSAETVRFHKIFRPGNHVKLKYFTQCLQWSFYIQCAVILVLNMMQKQRSIYVLTNTFSEDSKNIRRKFPKWLYFYHRSCRQVLAKVKKWYWAMLLLIRAPAVLISRIVFSWRICRNNLTRSYQQIFYF